MLVSDRTRIKNRIHSILHQRLIPNPAGKLFCDKNLAWLRSAISIDADGRDALDCQLRLLDHGEAEIVMVNPAPVAPELSDIPEYSWFAGTGQMQATDST